MKAIINGKIYDTKTAKIVASGDNGDNLTSCWYRSVEIYRTPRGNYFVCDERPNLIPLRQNTNGKWYLDYGDDYPMDSSLNEFVRSWRVTNFDEREIDLFGFKNA